MRRNLGLSDRIPAFPHSDTEIAAPIDKGGSAADHAMAAAPENVAVGLRIPTPPAERLTRALEDKMPRHTWILESIVERLDREA